MTKAQFGASAHTGRHAKRATSSASGITWAIGTLAAMAFTDLNTELAVLLRAGALPAVSMETVFCVSP